MDFLVNNFYAVIDLGTGTGFGDQVPNTLLAKIL